MTRAIWRPSPGPALAPSPVRELSAAEMFTDAWMENSAGRSLKNASLLGQTVHMRGTVRGMSAAGSGSRRLYLACDSFVVPIDASGCQCAIEGLSAGCVVCSNGDDLERAYTHADEALYAVKHSGTSGWMRWDPSLRKEMPPLTYRYA